MLKQQKYNYYQTLDQDKKFEQHLQLQKKKNIESIKLLKNNLFKQSFQEIEASQIQKQLDKFSLTFKDRKWRDSDNEQIAHRLGLQKARDHLLIENKNKAKLFIPDDHNEKINQLVDQRRSKWELILQSPLQNKSPIREWQQKKIDTSFQSSPEEQRGRLEQTYKSSNQSLSIELQGMLKEPKSHQNRDFSFETWQNQVNINNMYKNNNSQDISKTSDCFLNLYRLKRTELDLQNPWLKQYNVETKNQQRVMSADTRQHLNIGTDIFKFRQEKLQQQLLYNQKFEKEFNKLTNFSGKDKVPVNQNESFERRLDQYSDKDERNFKKKREIIQDLNELDNQSLIQQKQGYAHRHALKQQQKQKQLVQSTEIEQSIKPKTQTSQATVQKLQSSTNLQSSKKSLNISKTLPKNIEADVQNKGQITNDNIKKSFSNSQIKSKNNNSDAFNNIKMIHSYDIYQSENKTKTLSMKQKIAAELKRKNQEKHKESVKLSKFQQDQKYLNAKYEQYHNVIQKLDQSQKQTEQVEFDISKFKKSIESQNDQLIESHNSHKFQQSVQSQSDKPLLMNDFQESQQLKSSQGMMQPKSMTDINYKIQSSLLQKSQFSNSELKYILMENQQQKKMNKQIKYEKLAIFLQLKVQNMIVKIKVHGLVKIRDMSNFVLVQRLYKTKFVDSKLQLNQYPQIQNVKQIDRLTYIKGMRKLLFLINGILLSKMQNAFQKIQNNINQQKKKTAQSSFQRIQENYYSKNK